MIDVRFARNTQFVERLAGCMEWYAIELFNIHYLLIRNWVRLAEKQTIKKSLHYIWH